MKLVTDGIKATQDYLRSGKTLEQFEVEHGICGKTDGKHLILDYSQLDAIDSEPYPWVCRGLVLDAVTFEVIGMGLHRFKNFGEGYAATIDWSTAVAHEKLDGTMVNRWWSPHTGRFEYSTRFQLPASLVENKTTDGIITWMQLIQAAVPTIDLSTQPQDETWTLEVCSLHNKVVVRYPQPFAKILAKRNCRTLQEIPVGKDAPKSYSFASAKETIDFANSLPATSNEGFVVSDSYFNRIKIKSADYVNLHRLKDGLNSIRAVVNLAKSNDYEEVIVQLPEYKQVLTKVSELINNEIRAHEDVYCSLAHISDMKQFALALNEHKLSCSSALFSLHRGRTKSIKEGFYQLLEETFFKIFENRVKQIVLECRTP